MNSKTQINFKLEHLIEIIQNGNLHPKEIATFFNTDETTVEELMRSLEEQGSIKKRKYENDYIPNNGMPKVNEDQILDFLNTNPNFFMENPELIKLINLINSEDSQMKVKNLTQLQIEHLRKENKKVKQIAQYLIENLQHNSQTEVCNIDAIVEVLKAKNLNTLSKKISSYWSNNQNLTIRKYLISKDNKIDHSFFNQVYTTKQMPNELLDNLILDKLSHAKPTNDNYNICQFCSPIEPNESKDLFNQSNLKSAIIFKQKIDANNEWLLVFGCSDSSSFYTTMNCDMISLVAIVYNYLLKSFISQTA